MIPKAHDLANQKLRNPFRDSTAKTATDDAVTQEFYATSTFRSLFSTQHEILVGTRGSGKTILLRMMAFRNLLQSDDSSVRKYADSLEFIAFYVPLHLDIMSRYFKNGKDNQFQKEYFQFGVNCLAAISLLSEVRALIQKLHGNDRDSLKTESLLATDLNKYWFTDLEPDAGGFADLEWKIKIALQRTPAWLDGEERPSIGLCSHLFSPISAAIERISQKLGINLQKSTWIVCLDEAEFLDEAFLTCINTFMRSNKRPLTLKLATLPFHHTTLRTDINGTEVQPDGNDFAYTVIDMDPSDNDFTKFTNHLIRVRLERIDMPCRNLEAFLGIIGNDDPLDLYKYDVPEEERTQEAILHGILSCLSAERLTNYYDRQLASKRNTNAFLKRFGPVYYVRRVRKEDKRGARKVVWFSGPSNIRNVADGNPRRFLQFMNDLFERALKAKLTPRQQSEVVVGTASRMLTAASGLPDYGPIVHNIIEAIGQSLYPRVHGSPMVDGGCAFTFSSTVLEDPEILAAIKLACQYSHCRPEYYAGHTIGDDTVFRLSYLHAVNFWLPMRKGDSIKISQRHLKDFGQAMNWHVNLSDSNYILPFELTND